VNPSSRAAEGSASPAPTTRRSDRAAAAAEQLGGDLFAPTRAISDEYTRKVLRGERPQATGHIGRPDATPSSNDQGVEIVDRIDRQRKTQGARLTILCFAFFVLHFALSPANAADYPRGFFLEDLHSSHPSPPFTTSNPPVGAYDIQYFLHRFHRFHLGPGERPGLFFQHEPAPPSPIGFI